MPAYFEQGFFVREPAWHGMGVVLTEYPGREQAMTLAGHNFNVARRPIEVVGKFERRAVEGWRALVKSDDGTIVNVVRDSYEVIQNSEAYDIAEMLFEAGFQYETGITLKGGAVCALTLRLDEPISITGDDSVTLPFGCLSWAHDGSGSLRVRSGAIRQVCANTVSASEAEGRRLGTDFTFRHTKNVRDRIEDARKAVTGARRDMNVYVAAMEELAALSVTPEQRDLFVSTIIGDRTVDPRTKEERYVSKSADTTDRVRTNIERERVKVLGLFMGKTIPESHVLTGYGLHLAGVEYFDHLRNFKSSESYVTRTLLTDNPAKSSLTRTIRELVETA